MPAGAMIDAISGSKGSVAMTMYLERVGLFTGMSEDQLAPLYRSGRIRCYAPGTVVINEGDDGNSLFVVQQGFLKAYSMDDNGREITLSLLDPGDCFGELALLDRAPRSASVMAVEASRLLQIPGAVFIELMDRYPSCRDAVLRNLVSRVRKLTRDVQSFALVDVFGRIARLFEDLASENNGVRSIDRHLTQQEIANMVGASREMVNRILRDLVVGGYLSLEHERIVLHKKFPQHW